MLKAMSNCTNVIKTCMSEGLNALLVGYHGVSKTQMHLEEAKSLGLKIKYYSNSTLDPWSDLVGICPSIIMRGIVRHSMDKYLRGTSTYRQGLFPGLEFK